MLLEVLHLEKRFQHQRVVDNVSFTVADGERVALLGPNGAGKTTTLMMILGVTTADSGEVRVANVSVRQERAKALERVGFAAAYMTPPHSLTVLETLRIASAMAGMSLRNEIVGEMVERFDIGALVNRKGGDLSSGQKTLVGLARAAASKPELLILDEPTAYLDPSMSLNVREKVQRACEDWGSALLITSHNMRDIDHLCDRVIFLKHGRILHDLAAAELRRVTGTDDLDAAFIDLARDEFEGSELREHA